MLAPQKKSYDKPSILKSRDITLLTKIYVVKTMAFPIRELPRWHSGKESTCQCRRHKRHGFNPWIGKISWSRKWQPTPVFLPGKFHGHWSLVGYSPQGSKELDMTDRMRACVCAHTQAHTCFKIHFHRFLFCEYIPLCPFQWKKLYCFYNLSISSKISHLLTKFVISLYFLQNLQ